MKTRDITLIAILLACNIAISSFYIPVGVNLRIYFTFIINMLIACWYSYPVIFIYAICEDLLSFFIFPSGAFFFGYTLTSVVSLSLYYLFLHQKVDLWHIIFAKLSVNVIANILLNSYWSYILYSKAYLYYLGKSLFKNLAMLPIEIAIFYFVYKAVNPIYRNHH